MDFGQIYHFLFQTYAGVGVLIAAGLVITLILSFLLERKTRRIFKDRPKDPDAFSLFDDDDDDDDDGEAASGQRAAQ